MRRGSIIIFYLFFSTAFAISIQSSALAADGKGLESHLSIGIGWEQLDYEEHEPDTGTDSNAKVNNVIMEIEGLKRWESVFTGMKAIIPVLKEEDEEEWTSAGKKLHTNTFEYGWMRVDGYIGYPLTSFFNPYGGLRWSETKQDRTNCFVLGFPSADSAREIVRSWSFLLGVRGNGNFTPRWKWHYWLEYFVPIHVEATNSALPGFDPSDKGGYTLDLRVGVEYSYTEALSFGILVYGGRMHWDGSSWEPFPGGLTKWPENDTDYLGGILNISWIF